MVEGRHPVVASTGGRVVGGIVIVMVVVLSAQLLTCMCAFRLVGGLSSGHLVAGCGRLWLAERLVFLASEPSMAGVNTKQGRQRHC